MKNSFYKKIILFLFIGSVFIPACKQSSSDGYEMAESGLLYKFLTQNEKGDKPKIGDVVAVRLIYKSEKDSILFDTKKIAKDGSGIIEFPVQKPSFKGCFEEALMMMSVGDSANFKISADSIYLKTFKRPNMEAKLPSYIKPGTMLTFETKLEKIKNKDEVMQEQQKLMEERKVMLEKMKNEEPSTISKYVADNKITAKPMASGLYYIEKLKGKGKRVMAGDTVQVNYRGMFLDGKVFDSSERSTRPVEFHIGVGMFIKGWDEAIPMMNVGGKAQLIIPSAIGYGEMGSQGVIPPYAPLLFEVEVVGVKAGLKK